MKFDPKLYGPQQVTQEDGAYTGSRFSEMHEALFANPYYKAWGAPGELPLPTFGVTLRRVLSGILPFGRRWRFQQAAHRAVQSDADMRWGPDGRGFRRLLHPNGVCLFGRWEIDAGKDSGYTGYFKKGSTGLIIARYSTCCTECRRGRARSLALVGKIYPTTDPNHPEPLQPANFITQEDIGGSRVQSINDAEMRNTPDVTPWRRSAGVPIFLLTAIVLIRADKKITERQLYPIAELGKPQDEPTRAPEYMRLVVHPDQPRIGGVDTDFRDEILGQIYGRPNPRKAGDEENIPTPKRTLTFNIEVSDQGRSCGLFLKRVTVEKWKQIGRIVFEEAVASYNGDFVIHFAHPPWRNDRNDPNSLARPNLRRSR